jgi:dTDP-3-amino-2,3,6-trideoxy-4-keto-D-glucose/dTDP-3-amino-3,4,6-trideoxy-alpha-D-glucose/dTDP-2,6-dideoxy-D-kanosamine transaminase
VLESGWYVHGDEHAAFEAELATFLGVEQCIGVANGTDALELALRALLPDAGSVVVTAANAGMYATTAARRAGLRVRYADVDRSTSVLTWPAIEAVLDASVSLVVVTHLYGRAIEMDALLAGCHRRGIRVVEDCAQAIGARTSSGRAGSAGDAAAFSFYPTKNLGCLGDGGAVATPHAEVAERLRSLRHYGWKAKYAVAIDGGRNSRLDEVQAAILRVRLPRVDEWNRRRRMIIRRYREAAAETAVAVAIADGPGHAGHLAVAQTEVREHVRTALSRRGIQTDVHYPIADHRQEPYAELYRDAPLPNTEWLQDRIFSLPCFPELTEREIEQVCDALRSL